MEVLDRKETQRKQILIVEDEPDVAGMLKIRFESVGYGVRLAGTGQAALNCVKEETPDLVILDIKLPDISGYEVCRRLREFSKPWQIPVLMLTGLCQPADEMRGFAFGADAYLTKPFDSTRLLNIVNELVHDSTDWRQKHLPKELLENPQALANLPRIFRSLREGYVREEDIGQPIVQPTAIPVPAFPVPSGKEGTREGVNRRRIFAGAGVAFFLFLLAAVSIPKVVSSVPARFSITRAVLCREVGKDRSLVGAASQFPPGTEQVTCWFSWRGASRDFHVVGQWYYVTQDSPVLNIPITLTRNSSEGAFLLRMPPGKALPVGAYRFDFMVHGKVVKTLPFTVGMNGPAADPSEASS